MNRHFATAAFCSLILCLGSHGLNARESKPLLIRYDGQIDKLVDGKLIHLKKSEGGEGCIPVTRINPSGHTTVTYSGDFDDAPKIPHGNHMDIIVKGRLLHKHGRHYDDHGPLDIVEPQKTSKSTLDKDVTKKALKSKSRPNEGKETFKAKVAIQRDPVRYAQPGGYYPPVPLTCPPSCPASGAYFRY